MSYAVICQIHYASVYIVVLLMKQFDEVNQWLNQPTNQFQDNRPVSHAQQSQPGRSMLYSDCLYTLHHRALKTQPSR